MKHNELNSEANRLIEEFEKPSSVIPSAGWKSSLDKRLKKEMRRSSLTFPLSGITALILLVTLVNLLIIFAAILFNPDKSAKRENDLEILSRELFVNSNKLNY